MHFLHVFVLVLFTQYDSESSKKGRFWLIYRKRIWDQQLKGRVWQLIIYLQNIIWSVEGVACIADGLNRGWVRLRCRLWKEWKRSWKKVTVPVYIYHSHLSCFCSKRGPACIILHNTLVRPVENYICEERGWPVEDIELNAKQISLWFILNVSLIPCDNLVLSNPQTGESRTVSHISYTTWPDHGVPKVGKPRETSLHCKYLRNKKSCWKHS